MNIADCVEYLTWTYYFRRLVMNPSYYELEDSTTEGVERHLTAMIEGVLEDLVKASCITMEDDFDVTSTPLGAITSQYYLCYRTVGLFKLRLCDWRLSLTRPDFVGSSAYDASDGTAETDYDNDNGDNSDKNNGRSRSNGNKSRSNGGNSHGISRNNGSNSSSNSNNRHKTSLSGTQSLSLHLHSSGISLERLLQLLCDAFEFAELPVRHNEEHLNADLADELPWNTGEKSGTISIHAYTLTHTHTH